MPSESQLQKALQEQRDLERELKLLNEAEDARNSANRIGDFIAKTQEALCDPENPWISGKGPCSDGCQIL